MKLKNKKATNQYNIKLDFELNKFKLEISEQIKNVTKQQFETRFYNEPTI